MKRTIFLLYGVLTYIYFLAVFLYAIGFIGNIMVPVSIDSEPKASFTFSLLVNLGLLGIFAVQHSVMARPAFKRWWTGFIPEPLERSTYVLFTNLALTVIFVFWHPLGGVVWDVSGPAGSGILYGLYAIGWLLVLVSTLQINHFDLFGLRQVWLYYQRKEYTHLPFGQPWLYRHVRHPLYVGWFIVFWATPVMTVTHLLFAVVTSIYILVAVRFEERDLQTYHPEYSDYRNRVPMFIPRLW